MRGGRDRIKRLKCWESDWSLRTKTTKAKLLPYHISLAPHEAMVAKLTLANLGNSKTNCRFVLRAVGLDLNVASKPEAPTAKEVVSFLRRNLMRFQVNLLGLEKLQGLAARVEQMKAGFQMSDRGSTVGVPARNWHELEEEIAQELQRSVHLVD
uniref:Uncharacterized protein n=1 Tax=Pinguiococcus pyrenoidosus TaxID=172671 RepID=A0A7R9U798_9STRA|mmetsp:Transcript_15872/g.60463  ORF Transcript_15872/g.60463 Transcript_15872/m.60463 type:complete len:154 (+) Transcript_15872:1-462(+)